MGRHYGRHYGRLRTHLYYENPSSRRRADRASLESLFWDALMMIADDQRKSISAVIEDINDNTDVSDFSSAVRLFVLDYYHRRKRR
jgi:predicted DNA-binding ribbon-helix-helix protein